MVVHVKKKIILSSFLLLSGCFGNGSAPQPTLPSPQSPSSVVIHSEGRHLISPLQLLEVNSVKNGIILWKEAASLDKPQFKGFFLKNGIVANPVGFPASDISLMDAVFFLDPTGSGNLIWSHLKVDPLGSGNPKPLSMYPITNFSGTNTPSALGAYSLHGATVNESGDGFLLVSNEREPQKTSASSTSTRVYLIPVKKSIPQIKPLNLLNEDTWKEQEAELEVVADFPFHLGGQDVVLGANISPDGQGLIFFRDTQLKLSMIKVEKFKTTGEAQIVDGFPTDIQRSSLTFKLNQGEGYILWKNSSGVDIVQIQNYNLSKNAKKLSFPVQDSCNFANLPSVPAWDITLNTQGDGVASWLSEERHKVVVQKIHSFSFENQQKKLSPPKDLAVCMTKVQMLSPDQVLLAGMSTGCSQQSCESPLLESQKMIWSTNINLETSN